MKKTILIILLSIPTYAFAQRTIALNEHFVTQLIFESDISITRISSPDDFADPQVYKNIIFLQPLAEFSPSNFQVVCVDGSTYSIRLVYTKDQVEDFHKFSLSEAIASTAQRNSPAPIVASPLPSPPAAVTNQNILPVFAHILANDGFIASRNTVKYKSSFLSVTGIYSSNNQIYFRLNILNQSEIPYTIDGIVFIVKVRTTKNATTNSEDVLKPTNKYFKTDKIDAKSSTECIFEFDRFTLGKDYFLQIDCVEANGSRNLTLEINDDLFLQTKSL